MGCDNALNHILGSDAPPQRSRGLFFELMNAVFVGDGQINLSGRIDILRKIAAVNEFQNFLESRRVDIIYDDSVGPRFAHSLEPTKTNQGKRKRSGMIEKKNEKSYQSQPRSSTTTCNKLWVRKLISPEAKSLLK